MSSSSVYGTRANGGGHGDVQTAPEVVKYMLDMVGYIPSQNLSQIIILEPSCGNGEFVVEIARRLQKSARLFGFDVQEAFSRCIYACDIVAEKIACCQERLTTMGLDISHCHICTVDFLTAQLPEVDIVVGNPPYVRYENIPKAQLDFIKRTYPTFHYRADLFIPFFEKSLRLLKPNGKHSFICANRWLKNEYGKKLRRLVIGCFSLEKIINLEKADTFQEDVLAYPAITLITNRRRLSSFEYAETDEMSSLPILSFEKRNMPASDDWSDSFNTIRSSQLYTIEELGFKIGIGVATGADSIFISSELPHQVESELLLPAINARDLRNDELNWRGQYLLNPYSLNGELIDLSVYPKASAYLNRSRERLSARHVAQKNSSKWYKTIDRITPALRTEPKILLPDMSGNKYIFVDEGRYYPLHNIYYITGHDIKELQILSAILMSDVIRKQIKSITNNMNGGFPRWQSQYLRKLKVPDFHRSNNTVLDMIVNSYIKRDFDTINKQVKALYDSAVPDNTNSISNHSHTTKLRHRTKNQQLRLEFAV